MSDHLDQPAAAPAAPAPAAEKKPEDPVNEQITSSPENNTDNQAPAAAATTETPTATAETPAKQDKEKEPEKPTYLKTNQALSQFFDRLSTILKNADYNEMWGVSLQDLSIHVPTVNVLIKFLRANEGNVKLAEDQLTSALKWRKSMNPVALAETGRYDACKFGGLGYLTNYQDSNGKETVVTWNIYGGVKDAVATFDNMDEFIKWRVALMELAVKDLKLAESTSVMDYNGEDPYQMIQVHDYLNVSFLRMNPKVKAATKKTIEIFAMAYPELLREKFFVNVPAIMGWMFTAMKVFLSKNTTRKFHPITNGVNLAREFPTSVDQFPAAYGGKGPELQKAARTVNLDPSEETKEQDDPKEEAKDIKDTQEAPKGASKEDEAPEEALKEESTQAQESKDAPKEEAKGESKELPAEEPKTETPAK